MMWTRDHIWTLDFFSEIIHSPQLLCLMIKYIIISFSPFFQIKVLNLQCVAGGIDSQRLCIPAWTKAVDLAHHSRLTKSVAPDSTCRMWSSSHRFWSEQHHPCYGPLQDWKPTPDSHVKLWMVEDGDIRMVRSKDEAITNDASSN